MIYFLGDFLLSSFTNITSFLIILSWIPKRLLDFLLEGFILSILMHNILYLVVLMIMYLVNKISKIKLRNEISFFTFFTYNYLVFNIILWFINKGSGNILFNYFFNLVLVYGGYKLIKPYIKLK